MCGLESEKLGRHVGSVTEERGVSGYIGMGKGFGVSDQRKNIDQGCNK